MPGILVGRAPGSKDWQTLQVAAVLDLTAEFAASSQARIHRYRCVPMLDLVAPRPNQLSAAVSALEALHAQSNVLVHCALGYSRSAIVVAAWLLRRHLAADVEAAVEVVRKARPQVVFSRSHLDLLKGFHEKCCADSCDREQYAR